MINYTEAISIITSQINSIERKEYEIDILSALGMQSAYDIYTNTDFPRFNNSAMDGIAIKYKEGKFSWKLINEVSAGNFLNVEADFESCINIMTGAKIPDGFDTVIPIEDLIINEKNEYSLIANKVLKINQNIRYKGEDSVISSLIIKKNEIIEPKHIGILASCGFSRIKVLESLKIGVLVTGDELVDIDQVPENDQIIASNLYTLISLIIESGFKYRSFGISKDNKNDIKEKIQEALNSDIDFLITSGGVSEGKYDFIKEILEELGSEIFFWKANIKPGKPILFAKNNNKLIFGLPGNPIAVFVGFKIFIENAFIGNAKRVLAESEEIIRKKDGKRHFLRGILSFDELNKNFKVIRSGKQSSGDIYGVAKANCLMLIPEEINELKIGEKIECIMI